MIDNLFTDHSSEILLVNPPLWILVGVKRYQTEGLLVLARQLFEIAVDFQLPPDYKQKAFFKCIFIQSVRTVLSCE